jgi:hypothetical protein
MTLPVAERRKNIKNETDEQRADKRLYTWKEREDGHSVLKRVFGSKCLLCSLFPRASCHVDLI